MNQIVFYGPHLIIDGGGCRVDNLDDVSFVYKYLDSVPDLIDMQKISPPFVISYKGDPDPTEWGVTGFVLIATSHVSVHTYPAKHFVFVDLFSCKSFDIGAALEFTKKYFNIQQASHEVVYRGEQFPKVSGGNNA